MRAFVAIDLPEGFVAALEAAQERLPFGRLSDPETLHLTLAFLGEIDDAAAEEIHAELSGIAAGPIEVGLRGLESFSHVIAAGVVPDPALSDLRDRVVRAVRRAGTELERRRFRPHVTIARLRQRPDPAEAAALARALAAEGGLRIGPERAPSFSFFRSTLGPGGARHDALATYPLP